MEQTDIFSTVGLFRGILRAELESVLKCIGAETRSVKRGGILLLAGEKPEHVGVILSGQLHILREDYDGNRSLIAVAAPGGIFAEALCCAGVSESPVTVIADTDSTVMLLSFNRILHNCPNACPFHTTLIENMLRVVAQKNLQLQSRMEIISQRTIRARVMRYLETFKKTTGTAFTIPLNREELADFLNVERSALSHELMRMKKDGLLEYHKNSFTLL